MSKETIEVYKGNSDYPTSIDWRDHNAVTDPKDQGDCGSCWTFSSTGAMEGMYAIKYGTLKSFSEQQLVDCVYSYNGCGGGNQFNAFEYYLTKDVILEADYPYTATSHSLRRDC